MTAQSLFSGNQVHLRALEAADAPAIHAYLNHSELEGRRYLGWKLSPWFPLRVDDVAKAIEGLVSREKGAAFAVMQIERDEVIGHAILDWGWDPHSPDMSVVVSPYHWRQGIGLETASILLRYLFDYTPAHVVQGFYADWNEAAQQFASRLDFTAAGRERWDGLRDGQPYDTIMVDILRREWESHHDAA
jgi:RimJ/RimL family protein N-acetyltransferase